METAVVLAAGAGRRMGPLMSRTPKALLSCGGVTILDRILMQLSNLTRVIRIVIVVGHGADKLVRRVNRHALTSTEIVWLYSPSFAVTGSMYSLSLAKRHVEDGILLIDGDVLITDAVAESLQSTPLNTLLIDRGRHPAEMDMRVELRGNRVWEMDKDLSMDRCSAEFFGVSRLGPEVTGRLFEEMDYYFERRGVLDWYEFALRNLAKRETILWSEVRSDEWFEVDTPLDLARAQVWAERHPTTFRPESLAS